MATVQKEYDVLHVKSESMHCQLESSESALKQQEADLHLASTNTISCARCPNPTECSIGTAKLDWGDYSDLEHETARRIICSLCKSCVGIDFTGKWLSIEDALTCSDGATKHGWLEVGTDIERKIHYVLSQICYRELETPKSEHHEAIFDLPDPSDIIKILWINQNAIGFYTLKLKGTLVDATMDSYVMHTLDTAYVRSKHRCNGFGGGILSDLVAKFPGEDIGFSKPISHSMLRVIKKFLTEHSTYRNRFWELNGTGGEGNQKIIWYSFNRRK